MSAVKHCICKKPHKYGIETSTSAEHAYQIDVRNGNTFWWDTIQTEMRNNGIAFEVLYEGANASHGWHKVTGQTVFDVKMNFTRKTRWVLDGHKKTSPIGSTYSGVVSHESVHIAFPNPNPV